MWTTDIPPEGFYWIKYPCIHGTIICPCRVSRLGEKVIIGTTRTDIISDKGDGQGLRYGSRHGTKEQPIEFWSEEIVSPPTDTNEEPPTARMYYERHEL